MNRIRHLDRCEFEYYKRQATQLDANTWRANDGILTMRYVGGESPWEYTLETE